MEVKLLCFFSYSQYGQDLYLINSIFPNKTDGFFVDIGAYDGVTLSNTFILEQYLGWNGICVEPNPQIFEKLQANRSVICLPTALYKESGLSLSFLIDQRNAGVLSGFTIHHDHHSPEGTEIVLETSTLTSLLDDLQAPSYIEYISIDTEGSELEVLQGINFDKYQFGYMTIEHNKVEPKRSRIRDFLKSKRYYYHRENGGDDDFSGNSYKKLRRSILLKSELSKATELQKNENFLDAARIYWKILRYFPESYHALHRLSITMVQMGFGTLAVDFIRKAHDLAPDNREIASNLSKISSYFS